MTHRTNARDLLRIDHGRDWSFHFAPNIRRRFKPERRVQRLRQAQCAYRPDLDGCALGQQSPRACVGVAAMDGTAAQNSEMDVHQGTSRSARVVVLAMKVRSIMEVALSATSRHGGADPLDAATLPIGFSCLQSERAPILRGLADVNPPSPLPSSMTVLIAR
jgi:hypothetical protein